MGRLNYRQISTKPLSENKNIVISKAYEKEGSMVSHLTGYSASVQLVSKDEAGRETKVFLKNGLGILTVEGLENLREAVDEALHEIRSEMAKYPLGEE